MPLSLSHMAEPIFAEMVNQKRERLLARLGLMSQVDLQFVHSTKALAVCEAPLEPLAGRTFDGACRVDVLVRLRPELGTAFELKLGRTRLTSMRVEEEWLRPCMPSHEDSRWSGNMMAVLERRFSEPVPDDLFASAGEARCLLTPTWFLIVRRSILRAWERARPAFSPYVQCIAFEDVVEDFGGRDAFNRLVRDMVDLDFYQEWALEK